MGMIPSISDAFSFSSGGGDIGLGDNSSATGGNTSLGNVSGANIAGTVTDKSWLLSGSGEQTDKSNYMVMAVGTIVVVVGLVGFVLTKGRK